MVFAFPSVLPSLHLDTLKYQFFLLPHNPLFIFSQVRNWYLSRNPVELFIMIPDSKPLFAKSVGKEKEFVP